MDTELKGLFYLKRNNQNANGLCPVMGRITIGKTMTQFSLKLNADAGLWDTKAGRVNGKSKFAIDTNRRIDKTNLLIHTRYAELKSKQKEVKATEVKCAVQGIAKSQEMLLAYFHNMNEAFSERVGFDRRQSTYLNYIYSYRALGNFIRMKYKIEDIPFRLLTYQFIEDFHFYLRVQRKMRPKTVVKIMTHLGTVIKEAMKQGIILMNPFLGFKAEKTPVVHKTLTRDELEKIMSLELRPNTILSITRDTFIFACFTGLAYIDVKQLTAEEIVTMDDGSQWIMSRRQKTGTPFSVRLMDIPLSIIAKYKTEGNENLLFPSMPKNNNVYNRLNEIARKCEINKSIGFHMGRHTFASLITLSEGVPIETVSRMLGHRDIKTTQIYAELSLDKVAQDMRCLSERIRGQYTLID
jgi:integrase